MGHPLGTALVCLLAYGLYKLISKIAGSATDKTTAELIGLGVMLVVFFIFGGFGAVLFVIVATAFFLWLGEKFN